MFSMKGRRPKPNNFKNRTPGPGTYPIYGDFLKHPHSKKHGWVFTKAEKKIANSEKSEKPGKSGKKATFFGK